MTWVDLSGAFGYGSKLTSTQMQNLRDNIAALAAGDTGHPEIVEAALADSAVAQAKLKTSQGSVNGTGNSTLPGGEYGFYPQLKKSGGTDITVYLATNLTSTTYVTNVGMSEQGGATPYAQQRYVTASGEVYWIFILRQTDTQKIISVWRGPDHPCFGNGGKPELVPHPFIDFDPITGTIPEYDVDGKIIGSIPVEIIVFNPDPALVKEIQEKTIIASEKDANLDFIEVLLDQYETDEASNPIWPDKEVTVGLPPDWDEAWVSGQPVQPIKKVIPKPGYVLCKSLKLKSGKVL